MNFDKFQERVFVWMKKCFERVDALTLRVRAFRFTEEALELSQAAGVTKEEVLTLVEYTYGRPAGKLTQELGGVAVTLVGVATAAGHKVSRFALEEIARCETNTDAIREKDRNKPDLGPLPGAGDPQQVPTIMILTVNERGRIQRMLEEHARAQTRAAAATRAANPGDEYASLGNEDEASDAEFLSKKVAP